MATSITAIAMPKWGMEMTEGTVNTWHVAEGDSVKAGTDLIDIETSKIVNTLAAGAGGILRRILIAEGETVAVGKLLGVIADAAVGDSDIDAFVAGWSPESSEEKTTVAVSGEAQMQSGAVGQPEDDPPASSPSSAADSGTPSVDKPANATEDDSQLRATPVARKLARRHGVNLATLAASGSRGRVSKADVEAAVRAAGGQIDSPKASSSARGSSSRDDSDVRATPVARRLARKLGVNLHDCRTSGSRGRVSKADVEALVALRDLASATTTNTTEEPSAQQPRRQPLSAMRKVIAGRLKQSKLDSPHFRVAMDVRVEHLLALVEEVNAAHPGVKLTINDVLIKASASALLAVPAVNIQFDGETVSHFEHADISVAVAMEEGLITPIIRRADSKRLVEISTEMRDLSTRAKLGRLKADEYQGGTFTLSNLGMYGVKYFDAIINPPQAAILAVGSAENRLVIGEDGTSTPARVMTLTLSSDHRVIDGATAARFLQALKRQIESPALMLA